MRISDWSSDVCSSDRGSWAAGWSRRWRRTDVTAATCIEPGQDPSCATRIRFQHPQSRPAAPPATRHRHQADIVSAAAPPATRYPRPRSEEHTSELQSLMRISYAVFCLKKKKKKHKRKINKEETLIKEKK